MPSRAIAIVVTIAFSCLGVLGDYFLKLASEQESSLRTPAFYVGFIIYASTAFGWVFVMKYLQLGTVGAVYSVSMVLLLTTLGVLRFGESLSLIDVVGLLMAIGSLIVLGRFG